MGRFSDLLGTLNSKFKLGIGGPQLKNSAGVIQARDTADAAYSAMAALLFQTYGNDFELNSGAAGSGADWKYTLRRPSTGMTLALTVVMPSGTPAPGQAITVQSYSSGVITLEYTTIAGGTDKPVVDTTSLVFGSAGTLAMYTAPANAVHQLYKIVIDTAFTGAPTMSIGIAGNTSKYVAATQIDLTAAAGTVFEIDPGLASVGTTEALIITYAAGGAGAGAARILDEYVIPS